MMKLYKYNAGSIQCYASDRLMVMYGKDKNGVTAISMFPVVDIDNKKYVIMYELLDMDVIVTNPDSVAVELLSKYDEYCTDRSWYVNDRGYDVFVKVKSIDQESMILSIGGIFVETTEYIIIPMDELHSIENSTTLCPHIKAIFETKDWEDDITYSHIEHIGAMLINEHWSESEICNFCKEEYRESVEHVEKRIKGL